ncbi:MAG: CapA family protein [Hyphomicrobiaceae bacterium]
MGRPSRGEGSLAGSDRAGRASARAVLGLLLAALALAPDDVDAGAQVAMLIETRGAADARAAQGGRTAVSPAASDSGAVSSPSDTTPSGEAARLADDGAEGEGGGEAGDRTATDSAATDSTGTDSAIANTGLSASTSPSTEAAGSASETAAEAAGAAGATTTRPVAGPVTIVVAGDLGLNGSGLRVEADGVRKFGPLLTWQELAARIAPEIDGDLNFANLETVVSADNGLRPEPKQFNFRSHPDGVAEMVRLGFNMFSLANNHSMDFGEAGLRDTLTHVARLRGEGLVAAAGLGLDRERATRPDVFEIKGSRFAFGALGIITRGFGGHRAGRGHPGQAGLNDEDFREVVKRIAWTPADFRILSVHHGAELQVRAEDDQKRVLRSALAKPWSIDLVLGHHTHVAMGAEEVGGRVIFYGLGNFLHPGTADMAGKGICRDFGLVARLHLLPGADGRLAIRAIEALPVTATNRQTRRLPAAEAGVRVAVLNYLSALLDDPAAGAKGLRFTTLADGRGLYCAAGAETEAGAAGDLCRQRPEATAPSAGLLARIRGSCGGSGRVEAVAARDGEAATRSGKRRSKREKSAGRKKKTQWRLTTR